MSRERLSLVSLWRVTWVGPFAGERPTHVMGHSFEVALEEAERMAEPYVNIVHGLVHDGYVVMPTAPKENA